MAFYFLYTTHLGATFQLCDKSLENANLSFV